MTPKIAIIELDHHFEVLINSCRIFQNIGLDITIITKEKYVDEILKTGSFDNLQWIIWKETEPLDSFLQGNIDEINKFNVLVFNTFSKYFKEFSSIELKPKTILRIHNANAYFDPSHNLKFADNFYYLLKDTKYIATEVLLKKEWSYRKEFRQKINYYTFPTENIRKHVVSQNYISENQTVKSIPWSLSGKNRINAKNGKDVYITLTGAVDIRRRNYKLLHGAIKKVKDNFKNKVVLTFLGKPKNNYEKNTINSFKKLENDHLKFVSYSGWVPQNEFDSIMARTDFLVIPLYEKVKFTIYGELSGYTKISGNINDIILYSRPALISSFYPLEGGLKNVTEGFKNSDDLAEKLVKWVNEKSFLNYDKQLNELREEYSLNNIQNEVKQIFQSIL